MEETSKVTQQEREKPLYLDVGGAGGILQRTPDTGFGAVLSTSPVPSVQRRIVSQKVEIHTKASISEQTE